MSDTWFLGIAGTLVGSACMQSVPGPIQRWLSGEYAVKVVSDDLQSRAMSMLKDRTLMPIDLPLAIKMSEDSGLSKIKYYYLARAGYIGKNNGPKAVPRGISFSVDVNNMGIAYVHSYRLTSEQGSSEIAVMLISDTPLNGVVAICGAAE